MATHRLAPPEGPIRYGIIGSGMMGVEHIANIEAIDGAEVTAIADPTPSSQQWAKDTMADPSGLAVFEHHGELLDSGLCDAVVIATPNMTHKAVLDDVLGRDVHVLIEKPLCTKVADCHDVLAAAEDHPGVVWVGLEYRYMPPVAKLIDQVHSGAIGDLKMLAIREHRFPFLAKVNDWNRFNENSGGTLVEKCCHFWDLMNLTIGAGPVRIMASGAQDVNHLGESYGGKTPDILDNALAIVEYENGVRAMLDLCMFAEASEEQEEISAVGDLGKIEAFLPSLGYRQGLRADGRDGIESEIVHDENIKFEGLHHGSSYLEHLDFIDAIRSGGKADVTLHAGLMSVAMGVAAHRSIDEGRIVELAEVLADPNA